MTLILGSHPYQYLPNRMVYLSNPTSFNIDLRSDCLTFKVWFNQFNYRDITNHSLFFFNNESGEKEGSHFKLHGISLETMWVDIEERIHRTLSKEHNRTTNWIPQTKLR